MKLMEMTRHVHQLDAAQTIYVKKPWTPDSEAEVRLEEPGELLPSNLVRDGYEYFLEVDIAHDVVPALSRDEPSYATGAVVHQADQLRRERCLVR